MSAHEFDIDGFTASSKTDRELQEAWRNAQRWWKSLIKDFNPTLREVHKQAEPRFTTTQILNFTRRVLAELSKRGQRFNPASMSPSTADLFRKAGGPQAQAKFQPDRVKPATETVKKSLPNEQPEAGIHVHTLERENKTTKSDGAHAHIFTLPDGAVALTDESGAHTHPLEDDVSDWIPPTGEHTHSLTLPDGTVIETEADGEHAHQLQVAHSAFDGIHAHKLTLPDGTVIESPLGGQFWIDAGRPPQADNPESPPASEIAKRIHLPPPDEDENAISNEANTRLRRGAVSKQGDPYLEPPSEDEDLSYVWQHHYRGTNAHADFRMESGTGNLIGWTIFDAVADQIKRPVESVSSAKSADGKDSNWKINYQAGRFKDRQTASGAVPPAQLRATMKEAHPAQWLEVEGVTEPHPAIGSTPDFRGVFTILDKGRIEYGAQKSDSHEYFLSGGTIKGRLVMRRLMRKSLDLDLTTMVLDFPECKWFAQEVSKDLHDEQGSDSPIWIAIQPIEQQPLVLSVREVESGWIPAPGLSALPASVRSQIPEKFQYWNASGEDAARALRDELVAAITAGEVELDFNV